MIYHLLNVSPVKYVYIDDGLWRKTIKMWREKKNIEKKNDREKKKNQEKKKKKR